MSDSHLFVGLDVHKATIAIAVAEKDEAMKCTTSATFPTTLHPSSLS
jgi:hypothetical protein